MQQLPLNVQLDDSSTFDNFFVAENAQLNDKLNALVNCSGEFIYVWGAPESGKTHLAHALCHAFQSAGKMTAYLPLANRQLPPEIVDGMSAMSLICIDDIEQVCTDEAWQEKLFDLYNNIKHEGHQLVVFSRLPIAELPLSLNDLRSRLSAMEVYHLKALNESQQQAFLIQRAANRGMVMSDEVAQFILSRKSRSLADLMAVLERLDQSSIALKRKITIPLVKRILAL